jgi:hypothetical protein
MLFKQLTDNGYPSLALHGGMDQADRGAWLGGCALSLHALPCT